MDSHHGHQHLIYVAARSNRSLALAATVLVLALVVFLFICPRLLRTGHPRICLGLYIALLVGYFIGRVLNARSRRPPSTTP